MKNGKHCRACHCEHLKGAWQSHYKKVRLLRFTRNDNLSIGKFRSDGGFTLIELIIAMTVILIVSLGFFGWASTIIQTNLSIERNNTAYTMAMDVADRLQGMSDDPKYPPNLLIEPKGTNSRCVGFDSSGNLRKCSSCSGSLTVNSPTSTSDMTGKTEYTDPWGSSKLYMYDNNNCEGKTWVDSACGGTGASTITAAGKVTIDSTANPNIDHPNPSALVSTYNSVNLIRSYKNTTYYAVWSVAYTPCVADTNRRKIFVTVYWIDPEPTDNNVADVQTKIGNGTYIIKSVSVVVDKTIGTEG